MARSREGGIRGLLCGAFRYTNRIYAESPYCWVCSSTEARGSCFTLASVWHSAALIKGEEIDHRIDGQRRSEPARIPPDQQQRFQASLADPAGINKRPMDRVFFSTAL